MRFYKYHALGNDYLVLDPADFPFGSTPPKAMVRQICHRNFGIGSDGILWGPLATTQAAFGLRIFNPDGSEAEKSGNGLRIFARYLYDQKKVKEESTFTVETPGGVVEAVIHEGGQSISIEMGHVSFSSDRIPVTGAVREVLHEPMTVLDRNFTVHAATIGNPHCVVPLPEVTEAIARHYGPAIEAHPLFPNRTNVQFLQVLDRANIKIEIWERGAGYTLASGSSSSAAAAVAHRLGLVDQAVTVHMPGGRIEIAISNDFGIRMTGPVSAVASGSLDESLLAPEE